MVFISMGLPFLRKLFNIHPVISCSDVAEACPETQILYQKASEGTQSDKSLIYLMTYWKRPPQNMN